MNYLLFLPLNFWQKNIEKSSVGENFQMNQFEGCFRLVFGYNKTTIRTAGHNALKDFSDVSVPNVGSKDF
jgi:hypothetical protein